MAVNESAGLIRYKDKEGNLNILLPITTKDNVDGIDDIEASLSETIKFTKQTLTDSQKAQARDNLGIEAIVGYTHPETHPASMIEGLSEIATDGRFENLLNKPFFDLPKLETTDIAFTQFEEGYSLWVGELPGIWEQLLGETYKITWDGVEYTCVCKDASEVTTITNVHYFGNVTKILGAGIGVDTGEPFAITINVDTGTDGCGKPVVHTDDSKSWHTMSLTPVNPVKKIDPKYLPESYGNSDGSGSESGSSLPAFTTEDEGKVLSIKDGAPGWESVSVSGATTITEADVMSETDIDNFAPNSSLGGLITRYISFNKDNLDYCVEPFTIELGEKYTVVWDDEVWEDIIAVEATLAGKTGLLLGNGTSAGISGNGEPFAIAWQSHGVTFFSDDPTATSHKVRIYQKIETTAAISWNDLADKPFGEERGLVDLLPETTYSEFNFESDYGVYAASESVTYKLTVGETYTVFWDGQEYTCTAQDSSSVMFNTVCIGNASAFGLSGNNEPFLIVRQTFAGYIDSGMYIPLVNAGESIPHTIRIAQEADIVKKIDPKYSPVLKYVEPEEIDLVPETTLEGFVVNSTFGIPMKEIMASYAFTAGETYTINWDGTDYTCTAQDCSAILGVPGAAAVGNLAAFGLSGNSEPFIIGTTNGYAFYCPITDTDTSGVHTVRIYTVTEGKYDLKDEYLLAYNRGYSEKVIFDGTISDSQDGNGVWNNNYTLYDRSDAELIAGRTYKVVWDDGSEYTCTAYDIGSSAVYIGDFTIVSLSGSDGNAEPFLISRGMGSAASGENIWTVKPLHTIKDHAITLTITEITGEVKYLDNNLLDFMDVYEAKDIMINPRFPFDFVSENYESSGKSLYMAELMDTSEYGHFDKMTPGAKYEVIINDNVQIVTASEMAIPGVEGDFVFCGNKTLDKQIFGDDAENTYEDFLICVVKRVVDGAQRCAAAIYITTTDTHSGIGAPVSIKQLASSIIKKEYLPDDIGGGNGSNVGPALPEVSTEDAGKFLRVGADGNWIVEALQDVSEVGL